MEAQSLASAIALNSPKSPGGRGLPSSWATPTCLAFRNVPHLRLCSSSPSALSSASRAAIRASEGQKILVDEEVMETLDSPCEGGEVCTSLLTSEQKTFAALLLSLGLALGSAEVAMALGPEGPLVEEFWDNMRRYGLYFLTVFTGGLYSLLQPIFSLLRNPITAILTITVLCGSLFLLYLLLNTMLGITSFEYKYA